MRKVILLATIFAFVFTACRSKSGHLKKNSQPGTISMVDNITIADEDKTIEVESTGPKVGLENFKKIVSFIEKNGITTPADPEDLHYDFFDKGGNYYSASIIKSGDIYKGSQPFEDTAILISVQFHFNGREAERPQMLYDISPDRGIITYLVKDRPIQKYLDLSKEGYSELLAKIN